MTHRMELNKELMEERSKAAHEVFCAELKARGYRYGPVTSDVSKEHSSLKSLRRAARR